MENKTQLLTRNILFFLTIITVIILVFVAQILIEIKGEIIEIKSTFAKAEQEKISKTAFEPFKVLNENCTDCHSDRKFAGIHGETEEISGILKFMQQMPDANISPTDIDKIHSSLSLLKCVKCHSDDQIKILSTMNLAKQREIMIKMAKKTGSTMLAEDANKLLENLHKIQGF